MSLQFGHITLSRKVSRRRGDSERGLHSFSNWSTSLGISNAIDFSVLLSALKLYQVVLSCRTMLHLSELVGYKMLSIFIDVI